MTDFVTVVMYTITKDIYFFNKFHFSHNKFTKKKKTYNLIVQLVHVKFEGRVQGHPLVYFS